MKNIKQMNETELKAYYIETEMIEKVGKRIKFKNQAIQNTVNKISNRFKDNFTYDDVISLALELATDTVLKFEIRNGKGFEDVIAGDKELVGKLNKNINLVLKNRLQHIDDKAFYTFENATKRHVVIKPVMASLDITVEDGQGNEMVLIETVEKNFWDAQNGEHAKSFFVEWFLENRKNFLTKKQNEFVDSFIRGNEPKRKSGYVERIRDRAMAEFREEFGIEMEENQPNNLERQIQRKLGIYNSLLSIVEDDSELDNQNTKISNWFIKNMKKEEISNLIGDNLTGKEYRRVMYAVTCQDIGVEIPAKVLYKLVDFANKRVENLKNVDTTCVPFYKKPHEEGNWSKQAHMVYKEEQKKLNQQPTYVYDSEGELQSVIPFKPFKQTKTIIKTLTPSGSFVVDED